MDIRPSKIIALLLVVLIVLFTIAVLQDNTSASMKSFKSESNSNSQNDGIFSGNFFSSSKPSGSYSLGKPMMGRLVNETLRAELGRASWKTFHTIMARYPHKPSEEHKTMLRDYIYLFARMYPCGDCAHHFQIVLKLLPPRVESKEEASTWLCEAHNMINERLKKPVFDCTEVWKKYDCGCGDEDDFDFTNG